MHWEEQGKNPKAINGFCNQDFVVRRAGVTLTQEKSVYSAATILQFATPVPSLSMMGPNTQRKRYSKRNNGRSDFNPPPVVFLSVRNVIATRAGFRAFRGFSWFCGRCVLL